MYRYTLYTEDDHVFEFHSLDDAIAYAETLLRSCQMQSTIIDEVDGRSVYPK